MKAGDEILAKPRYLQVVDPKELQILIEHSGELDYPMLVIIRKAMWADASELRAWRLQHIDVGAK